MFIERFALRSTRAVPLSLEIVTYFAKKSGGYYWFPFTAESLMFRWLLAPVNDTGDERETSKAVDFLKVMDDLWFDLSLWRIICQSDSKMYIE